MLYLYGIYFAYSIHKGLNHINIWLIVVNFIFFNYYSVPKYIIVNTLYMDEEVTLPVADILFTSFTKSFQHVDCRYNS